MHVHDIENADSSNPAAGDGRSNSPRIQQEGVILGLQVREQAWACISRDTSLGSRIRVISM
ncbi:MAG: hypothetical protein CMJ36_04090 [Phycisphaerae bacterium]|nr:hypothetical protein [Phycisphaerae bacterium]